MLSRPIGPGPLLARNALVTSKLVTTTGALVRNPG